MSLSNLINGVEFKMKMYKGSDVDKYHQRLNQNNEFAEDIGIDMPEDIVELPEFTLGVGKYDPSKILYYVQCFSAEGSVAEKPKLDSVMFKYQVTPDYIEEIVVYHTYKEFEDILKKWYKNNNKNDGDNNRV